MTYDLHNTVSLSRCLESFVDVDDDVVQVFDSDRKADQVVQDAELLAYFQRNGSMGHQGRALSQTYIRYCEYLRHRQETQRG